MHRKLSAWPLKAKIAPHSLNNGDSRRLASLPLALTLTYAPCKEMRWQQLKYEMKRDEVNMNIRFSRFIVPKKLNKLMTTYSYTKVK
jgi:hypothetical protein